MGGVAAAGVAGIAGAGIAWRSHQANQPARLTLPKAKSGAPNILLIVTDQERGWDLLPAGFVDRHCPTRSRLLAQSVSFDQAHTPSPFCSMARSTIYTGQHPQVNGLWENIPLPYATNLKRATPTLGTMFGAAGYHSAYFGKWHLSRLHDQQRASFTPEQVRAELQGYGFAEIGTQHELDGPLGGFNSDGDTTRRAVDFLRSPERAAGPWFCAVNLLNPHDIMYYTSGEAMTRSRRMDFPDALSRPPADPFYAADLGYGLLPNYGPKTLLRRPEAAYEYGRAMDTTLGVLDYADERTGREFQNYYYHCIRDTDRHLMRLLQALQASGQDENTVVVFTADHGELLGAHGLRGKGTVPYREAVRVPLLVRLPDGARGARTATLASHVDLAPTLLAAAGVPADAVANELPRLAGRDLSAHAGRPDAADPRAGHAGDGILLHWTSLAAQDHDSLLAIDLARRSGGVTPLTFLQQEVRDGMQRRGQMRGVTDGRYKFARYFKPTDHHRPRD
ncbi:MAG: sulfatase-like hydrolase/transferase, partial [Rubrivivax sp.]